MESIRKSSTDGEIESSEKIGKLTRNRELFTMIDYYRPKRITGKLV